jgi:hypothetical protein
VLYKQLYTKRLVQTAVCLMDAGKDTKKKINVLETLHYTVAALQQVTQQTIENCSLFFYAHSTSDSDRESVLGLEKSYYELRRKVCTKQMSIKDFFSKK